MNKQNIRNWHISQ